MLIEMMKADFEFSSESGSLVQLVHEGWKQVNVLKSFKGSSRGGHYHKENEEAFYVVEGRLILTVSYENTYEKIGFAAGDMFKIFPFQLHTFEFMEDTILISMYSSGVEKKDGTKDIYEF